MVPTDKHSGLLRYLLFICAVVALIAITPFSFAQDAETIDKQDVIRLIEQLNKQQEEIDELHQTVGELKAQTGDKWLTETRAREIRQLVAETLEDADSRASLMQDGLMAGWDDGFFLASQDGRFLLEIDGQMQIRMAYSFQNADDVDHHRIGFENTRTKLTYRGHVFGPDLTYLVRMDVSRNEPGLVTGLFFLQDSWVRYKLANDWSFRFGQFKVPFSREELVSPAMQLAVERSLTNESSNLGRTQGVEIAWAGEHLRASAITGDGATANMTGGGIISPGGSPINSNAISLLDVDFTATARAEWKLAGTWAQFRDFTSPMDENEGILLGVGIHYQVGESGDITGPFKDEDDWLAWTVDASFEWGGANLFLSFIHHNVSSHNLEQSASGIPPERTLDVYGAVVQGGMYFTPKMELFARYSWGQVQTNATRSGGFRIRDNGLGAPKRREGLAFHTLNVATVGFNYYFDGHDAKWTTDFGFAFTEVDLTWNSDIAAWRQVSGPGQQHQVVFRTQFQLLF